MRQYQASELDPNWIRRVVHLVQKGEKEARIAKKGMVEANLRLVISIAKEPISLETPIGDEEDSHFRF